MGTRNDNVLGYPEHKGSKSNVGTIGNIDELMDSRDGAFPCWQQSSTVHAVVRKW